MIEISEAQKKINNIPMLTQWKYGCTENYILLQ